MVWQSPEKGLETQASEELLLVEAATEHSFRVAPSLGRQVTTNTMALTSAKKTRDYLHRLQKTPKQRLTNVDITAMSAVKPMSRLMLQSSNGLPREEVTPVKMQKHPSTDSADQGAFETPQRMAPLHSDSKSLVSKAKVYQADGRVSSNKIHIVESHRPG